MGVRDALDDGEPEAGARVVGGKPRLEHFDVALFGDPRTVVFDEEATDAVTVVEGADANGRVGTSVFADVAEEVLEQGAQPLLVGAHPREPLLDDVRVGVEADRQRRRLGDVGERHAFGVVDDAPLAR